MMRSSCLVLCLALMVLTGSASHAAQWIVPAGAHATGALDTNWRTDLRLVNPTESEVSVTVYLLKNKADNSALDISAVHAVPAHGQVVIGDVFMTDFEYNGTGALLIECDDANLVANTRTYNLISDGSTYGQFVPGVPVADAQQSGEEAHIIYLAKSDSFRSNVGFSATTSEAGSATVELFSDDGVSLGSRTRNFQAYEQFQWNDIFDVVGAPASTAARAVVTTTAPIVAYGSVADAGTGDPVAIMTLRPAVATTEQAFPAAARARGELDSLWRTDIRVYNPNDTPAMVTFVYHRKGVADKARPSATMSVGADSILALDDAMMSGLGLESANGGVMVSSDLPVLTWSRTYNLSESGILGQSVPAVPVGSTSTGEWIRDFSGLSKSGFRSNTGFFNLGDVEQTLELTMRDASGTVVGEGSYDLGPGEMNQINDVFAFLGVTAKNGADYSMSIAGEGDVATYTSVADNLSQDTVYDAGTQRAADDGGDGEVPEGCVAIGFPPVGAVAFSEGTGTGGGYPFTGTVETTYGARDETGGSAASFTELNVLGGAYVIKVTAETTSTWHTVEDPLGWYALEMADFEGNTDTNGTVQDDTGVTTYTPAQLQGPLTMACEGQMASVPSVTARFEPPAGEPTETATDTYDVELVAVDEVITVPVGTFTTVHTRQTMTSGENQGRADDFWFDIATGILLRLHRVGPIDDYIFEVTSITTK